MKYLSLALLFASTSVFAAEPVSGSEKTEIESLLAEAGSKMIYLKRECDLPVDYDKFKELAKIKAFSEGHLSIEGISWANVKRASHIEYGMLKIAAPLGESCEQIRADIKGLYRFLK